MSCLGVTCCRKASNFFLIGWNYYWRLKGQSRLRGISKMTNFSTIVRKSKTSEKQSHLLQDISADSPKGHWQVRSLVEKERSLGYNCLRAKIMIILFSHQHTHKKVHRHDYNITARSFRFWWQSLYQIQWSTCSNNDNHSSERTSVEAKDRFTISFFSFSNTNWTQKKSSV